MQLFYLTVNSQRRAKYLLKKYTSVRCHTHGAAVIGKIDGLEREELQMKDLLKKIKPYVWPDKKTPDGRKIRSKVVKTGSLIFAAKSISVITPWFYKNLIDTLTG